MKPGHSFSSPLKHPISKGLCLLCLLASSALVSSALANDNTPLLSSRIYHHLAHLQPDIEAGRLAEARTQLEALLPTTRGGNPYDRAVLLRLLGQMQARLQQPERAISAFEEAAALDSLPREEALQLKRELAQLYVRQARYTNAVSLLERLPEQDRDSRLLLAQSYLQLARYRDALQPLKELIQASQPADKHLYEALFFAQHSLGESAAASSTLQRLIALAPQTLMYWRQLAALHYENNRADRALAVLEAAYHQGVLKDSPDDLLNLVNLYRSQGAPYKAARLLARLLDAQQLEDRIALREQLVDLWLSARETAQAVKALEHLITRAPSPERWLRLGQLRIEQRDWPAAARALSAAIDTNTAPLATEKLAVAWLWLGIVYVENGRRQDALAAFRHSERFTPTQPAAQQWLRYLESVG